MKETGTQNIITERLKLSQFKKEDINEVYENYGKDEKIRKYISWIPCETLEKCEKFIEYNLNEYKTNKHFFSWKIEYHEEIVGSIAIFNVDENANAGELGYSLGSKWWKNGIITESGKAVTEYAFKEAGFHRIYASCHEDNIGSKKVMQKLGMKFEGKLRDGQRNLDGTYSNLDLYSILENEI